MVFAHTIHTLHFCTTPCTLIYKRYNHGNSELLGSPSGCCATLIPSTPSIDCRSTMSRISLARSSVLAASASKTLFAGMPSATNRLLIGCTLNGIRPKTELERQEKDVNARSTSPRCRPPPSFEICMTPLCGSTCSDTGNASLTWRTRLDENVGASSVWTVARSPKSTFIEKGTSSMWISTR